MKKNFKNVVLNTACILAVMAMVLPIVGLAASRVKNTNVTSTSEMGATGKNGVCLQAGNLSSKIDQRLTERETEIQEKRMERTQNFEAKRERRDRELEQLREKWNENREQFYAKLTEKADTDAKKQALVKFKAAVEAAVKARRAAIDQANGDYRAATDKLVASRKTAIDAVKLTYRNAIRAAFKKANDDCAKSDADSAKIREQLKTELKANQDKYQADVQAAEKVGKSVQELITARRDSVAKALADFKVALEKAKIDLKAAGGTENSSDANNSQ